MKLVIIETNVDYVGDDVEGREEFDSLEEVELNEMPLVILSLQLDQINHFFFFNIIFYKFTSNFQWIASILFRFKNNWVPSLKSGWKELIEILLNKDNIKIFYSKEMQTFQLFLQDKILKFSRLRWFVGYLMWLRIILMLKSI